MTKRNPPPIPGSPEADEATRQFLLAYGTTLASWAMIEETLGQLFHRLIGTHPVTARLLFFSGRSFATRADLYGAAIDGAIGLSDLRKEAHKKLLTRARDFSSARNSIAHGIPINLIGGGPYEGVKIKQGQKAWQAGGIGMPELELAGLNFQKLSDAAKQLLWSRDDDDQAAQECLELVLALPKRAIPHESNPNQEGIE